MIWGNLLHLSYNMWSDVPLRPGEKPFEDRTTWYEPDWLFDEALWNELTEAMAAAGLNLVVIDLGDAVRYESHPEIALDKAWSTDRLRSELSRLRGLGLEPIPKLNFSTAHDAWLGPYSRQVSTEPYYTVVADLIAEVSELFDRPRFFHIGMDEETAHHQRDFEFAVMRQHDLWWHDLRFMIDNVTRAGSRAWVWSDPAWRHPDTFYQRMPKDVIQSNWYYNTVFSGDESGRPKLLEGTDHYMAYLDLDEHGYEQIPTASSWRGAWDCFGHTVDFCRRRIDTDRLLGYLQTSWRPTVPYWRDTHLKTIDLVKQAKDALG